MNFLNGAEGFEVKSEHFLEVNSRLDVSDVNIWNYTLPGYHIDIFSCDIN